MIKNISKSLFITAFTVLTIAGCDSNLEQQSQRPNPPNILILYIDDLGVNDVGIYGSEHAKTPTLDRIAQEGVRFTRHYADATCSPARAALMSGRFPARAGFSPNGPGLSPQLNTLPRALKSLGYSTHHVGKWHMGHISTAAWPDAVGFDTWLGYLSQWLMAKPYDHSLLDGLYSAPTYINPWLHDGSNDSRQYQGHLTDIVTERTISLIKDSQNII